MSSASSRSWGAGERSRIPSASWKQSHQTTGPPLVYYTPRATTHAHYPPTSRTHTHPSTEPPIRPPGHPSSQPAVPPHPPTSTHICPATDIRRHPSSAITDQRSDARSRSGPPCQGRQVADAWPHSCRTIHLERCREHTTREKSRRTAGQAARRRPSATRSASRA